jgi:hypothetical protein
MAYRGQDAGDALEAPTLEGTLVVGLGANRIALTVGTRSLHLADRVATVTETPGKTKKPRRVSLSIEGIVLARGVPREDIGVWIEAATDREPPPAPPPRRSKRGVPPPANQRARISMRRIFGVSPVSLFEEGGLVALSRLDALATQLRLAIDDFAAHAGIWAARATEIGAGHALDKVLFVDLGDRHAIYARRLFRDRARLLATVHPGGRVVIEDDETTEVLVTSRYGVTVRGDHVRFADRHGTDVARISLPWVSPEDRDELARRIGQLVHRG